MHKLTLHLTEMVYTIIISQIMVLRVSVSVGKMLANKGSALSKKT